MRRGRWRASLAPPLSLFPRCLCARHESACRLVNAGTGARVLGSAHMATAPGVAAPPHAGGPDTGPFETLRRSLSSTLGLAPHSPTHVSDSPVSGGEAHLTMERLPDSLPSPGALAHDATTPPRPGLPPQLAGVGGQQVQRPDLQSGLLRPRDGRGPARLGGGEAGLEHAQPPPGPPPSPGHGAALPPLPRRASTDSFQIASLLRSSSTPAIDDDAAALVASRKQLFPGGHSDGTARCCPRRRGPAARLPADTRLAPEMRRLTLAAGQAAEAPRRPRCMGAPSRPWRHTR